MLDKIKLGLNGMLPKKWLTEVLGRAAEQRAGWLTKTAIEMFIWFYKIDMREALKPDPASYKTFNAFFTRELKADARPVEALATQLVSPVDGTISQLGCIEGERLFQAKDHHYTLTSLLAGNQDLAAMFQDGLFLTTYLAPSDYHRVHMPCNGVLRKMIYVPGALYSVNPLTASAVANLFARNERVICYFTTEFGPMVQILVGATIVGSIETTWSGTVTPPREGVIKCWQWPEAEHEGAVVLLKGQEMGLFKLGSTVINLFASGNVQLQSTLQAGGRLRCGQVIADGTDTSDTTSGLVAEE